MATDSDYLIRNPKQVFGHLTDLVKNKCIISAHFGENNSSFLTTIVTLDAKNDVLQLDCAPTPALDKELLESAKVLFRTELDGIKVSFSGKGIKKIKHGDYWVFSMPIPGAIFWMQRRNYYRVKVPLSHADSYCRLTFKVDGEQASEETVNFPLYDISITGFAFTNPDPKWSEYLQAECQFTDGLLHLHNGNEAAIAFTIVTTTAIRTSPTSRQQRVGCRFTPLPAHFETPVQRYMQEIQLQQKNVG